MFRIKYEDFVETYSKQYQSSKYYSQVMKKFKHGQEIREISKHFNISYRTVWSWVKNKTIPIPYIEYIKIKKKFNKNELSVLAPVMGYLFGDGGISRKGDIHYCNTEEFLVNDFVSKMTIVFNIKPVIRNEKSITRVRYPRWVGKSLWYIFGKFSFGKDTKNITSQIEKMPLNWKINMLRTWFNDDGSVPKYGVIAIKQKLRPLLIFIKKILSELDIESKIDKDDNRWHLRICGYKNMLRFKEKIDFSKGYRKSQELTKIIDGIKHPHNMTKKKILKLLKEYPKTRENISELLKLKSGTVYGHLHGWKRKDKKRKTTIGLVDMGLVKFRNINRTNVYSLNNSGSEIKWATGTRLSFCFRAGLIPSLP